MSVYDVLTPAHPAQLDVGGDNLTEWKVRFLFNHVTIMKETQDNNKFL